MNSISIALRNTHWLCGSNHYSQRLLLLPDPPDPPELLKYFFAMLSTSGVTMGAKVA